MPGLMGFTADTSFTEDTEAVLRGMQGLLTHESFQVGEGLFSDGAVWATRVHNGVKTGETNPAAMAGVHVWLDGEIYNAGPADRGTGVPASGAENLLGLYAKDRGFGFLDELDGIFSAVVYDSANKQVHLVTDRYGLRHLYFTRHRGSLAWGSETKAFLALPSFRPVIDRQAAREFLGIGYLLENRSLLEGVELVPSGTVLTWDIPGRHLGSRRYWWWDHIQPLTGKPGRNRVADEMKDLFEEGVRNRWAGEKKPFVLLSGGIDSRAVLAAVPEQPERVQAVTFGIPSSRDVAYARMACEVRGAGHHLLEIDSSNWLSPRISGVWRTDGQMNLLHMHGVEHLAAMREISFFLINGFAGDLILGGSYLKDERFFDTMNRDLLAERMECPPELLTNYDGYRGLGKLDFYFLQNRVRRFTAEGDLLVENFLEPRKPFHPNRLVEMAYSLPDNLRHHKKIYKKMLLRSYPGYFRDIPIPVNGITLGWHHPGQRLARYARSRAGRIHPSLGRNRDRSGLTRHYTDYADWIRREPARSYFAGMLNSPSAKLAEFVPRASLAEAWESHLRGKDVSETLCRYLTLELWLRQLYEGTHRNEPGGELV